LIADSTWREGVWCCAICSSSAAGIRRRHSASRTQ
jgi:hypothetical protein